MTVARRVSQSLSFRTFKQLEPLDGQELETHSMKRRLLIFRRSVFLPLISTVWLALLASTGRAQSEREEFFETRIRPVLSENCQSCHGELQTSGLRVDSRDRLLKGGSRGPALVPGNPEASLLIQAVSHSHPTLKMPPSGQLPQHVIQDLATWVQEGSVWPRESARAGRPSPSLISQEDRSFWSFLPLKKPVVDSDSPIDELVRAVLNENGLKANPPASKRTLLRRVSFNLIGLPPTPEEVTAFLADTSPQAFPAVVDRLLRSPHFGERWGRYWLDVARYGENDYRGINTQEYPQAWRYRDWVVEAFNSDMPYDLFVKAQIAADLLPGDNRSLLGGLGLFALGPWYYNISHPPQARADERHDRVDMITRGFLGLTAACARCHDHKYDPISMKDYYGLAGVFASVHYKSYPLVSEEVVEDFERQKKKIEEIEKEIEDFLKRQSDELAEIFTRRISRYMVASWKVLAPSDSGKEEKEGHIKSVAEQQQLNKETLERWVKFLGKPQTEHPHLDAWRKLLEDGSATETQVRQVADDYQALIVSIVEERKQIEEEIRVLLARLPKKEKRERTRLPNGYTSGDGFEPPDIEPRIMTRDRFVAWQQILGEGRTGPGLNGSYAVLRYQGEELERFLQGEWKSHLQSLRAELEERKRSLPSHYAYFPGLEDWQRPRNAKLKLRGNPFREGEEVPHRFLAVLSQGEPPIFRNGSGRLELAEAIIKHPLAGRVISNRIWQHLLGNGIVPTPSNFGKTGGRPSNPELLEYLAWRLVDQKWSIKKLIREIVLSETYQLSSDHSKENEGTDPANRFFWRANRTRLDAEALLDATLFVSGQLDPKIGGPSQELAPDNHRRTVYVKVGRIKLDETLALFDYPSPSVTSAQRVVTNVPLQRLFFLNSEFILCQAEALAQRLRSAGSDVGMIQEAYPVLYGREASPSDVQMGQAFLRSAGKDGWVQYAQVLLSSNEFAFVD